MDSKCIAASHRRVWKICESTTWTVYLRLGDGDSVQVSFCVDKSTDAPTKQMTIPCLELTDAVLNVRADAVFQKCPRSPVFWSDSSSVLAYICEGVLEGPQLNVIQ